MNDFSTLSPIYKKNYGEKMKDRKEARKQALRKYKDGGKKGFASSFLNAFGISPDDEEKRSKALRKAKKEKEPFDRETSEREDRSYVGGTSGGGDYIEKLRRQLAEERAKKRRR